MKTHIYIPLMHRNAAPDLIAQLADVHPQGMEETGFFLIDLPEDDPRTVAMLDILRNNGFQPWSDKSHLPDRSSEYVVTVHRVYEDDDFDDVELVCPTTWKEGINCNGRDEEGRVRVEFHRPHVEKIPLDLLHGSVLVRDHVKRAIESIDPKQLGFRETVLVTWWDDPPRVMPWEEEREEPWWEITSDFSLPPLAPSMTVKRWETRERLPRGAGADQMCFVRDPDEPRDLAAEFHFCRSEIEALEPFDAAQTHELVNGSHQLVFSSRVYRAIRDAGIKIRWIPCRLDEC